MTRIKRPAAALAAAVLLALSLTACGGDGDDGSANDDEGAPTEASEDEFCEVFREAESAGEDLEDDDFDGQADLLNEYADKLDEIGTPEDIPDDARHGFEVLVEAFGDVRPDDLEDEDAGKALEEKYEDDREDVEAFFDYYLETCQPGFEQGTPDDPAAS